MVTSRDNNKKGKVVAVVGSLNMDTINLGETYPGGRIQVEKIMEHMGGKGANQAVAVYRASHENPQNSQIFVDSSDNDESEWAVVPSKHHDALSRSGLKTEVHMVGMVGSNGMTGESIKSFLNEMRVGVKLVKSIAGDSGSATININKHTGSTTIQIYRGANAELKPEYVKEGLSSMNPRPDVVLLQLEIPIETVKEAIRWAKHQHPRIPVIFNVSPMPEKESLTHSSNRELLKVDHLILKQEWADKILRLRPKRQDERGDINALRKRYMDACNELHSYGADCVVITLGSYGVVASYLEPGDETQSRHQNIWYSGAKIRCSSSPARSEQGPSPLEVKDETGAADAFIGAYTVEILRKLPDKLGFSDIVAAISMGIRAGGHMVTEIGAMSALPWRDDLFASFATTTDSAFSSSN